MALNQGFVYIHSNCDSVSYTLGTPILFDRVEDEDVKAASKMPSVRAFPCQLARLGPAVRRMFDGPFKNDGIKPIHIVANAPLDQINHLVFYCSFRAFHPDADL